MALRLLHFHRTTIEMLRSADRESAPDAKAIFDELAARVAEIKAEAAARGGEAEDGGA
jgi:predicted ThiF/HesA family dinucleotide-utilizing enzyme